MLIKAAVCCFVLLNSALLASNDKLTVLNSYARYQMDEGGLCLEVFGYSNPKQNSSTTEVNLLNCSEERISLVLPLKYKQSLPFTGFTDPVIVDFNFDGYYDFLIAHSGECGSGGCHHRIFLFNPKTKQFKRKIFEEIDGLNIIVDSEKQIISAGWSSGAVNSTYKEYKIKDNHLILIREILKQNGIDKITDFP